MRTTKLRILTATIQLTTLTVIAWPEAFFPHQYHLPDLCLFTLYPFQYLEFISLRGNLNIVDWIWVPLCFFL